MAQYDTNDITDEAIKQEILEVNRMYADIIYRLYNTVDAETKKRIHGMIRHCCNKVDLELLTRLIRIFMENYKSRNNNRLPLDYAAFAILYYYYQLALIESNVTGFLDLRLLKLYGVDPEYISGIHILSNFLITSDEPYVVEIRKSILKINDEPFVGGKNRRRKIGTRYRRKIGTRNRRKIGTRRRR